MKHEKSCGAVVFSRQKDEWNVLLIRHEKGRHISFPKGHVENGETEKQTAEREIFEETGINVTVDTDFRAENRYMARPDVEKLVVFFVGIADAQKPIAQKGEVAIAEWVPVKAASGRLTYERDRRILQEALGHIS